ncbi:hypothetical protein OS189_01915 [Sulfitobacter sp. F26169L]|uniref:hypothetical protein n=1 Tax=Sulfitobacter sp. F26169L TaxID=2996015 RepID=UPI0022609AEC|nr:hypothetical protein [Sulfitobacter sp. F26169L]MCX7565098.1 hypothetical protein [Sulfitobacter sp. F26169L]
MDKELLHRASLLSKEGRPQEASEVWKRVLSMNKVSIPAIKGALGAGLQNR